MEDYKVFSTVKSLQERLHSLGKETQVSFVATMGALHHGHLELVKKAFTLDDTVVVSIFVNPTQFNKKEDLENYPRLLDEDLKLLKTVGDVIVFAPTVDEVYPKDYVDIDLNLGKLEHVMEGEFRPGHFKGVVNVVKRFFDIINPTYALFGLKDFQQLAVIEFMVEHFKLSVQVVGCETVREPSGLASSSRNFRLSEQEKVEAEIIYKTMEYARSLVAEKEPTEVQKMALEFFSKSPLEIEYLEIVDPKSLDSIPNWVPGARICIATMCGKVRLIDNSELIENSFIS